MAICHHRRIVGFLMYGLDPQDHRHWLYRFMIDERYQGQGYGTAALEALLGLLKQLPGCTELNVGYDQANLAAERLYLKRGFEKTGVAPWGELTARVRWE
jgi:diamine N-acetyltransferase